MKVLTPELQLRWNAIVVDVLKEFIKICEENHLTYFCAGGTVLGTVRHKGMIPWDDDIDINMPRPDFDRFFEICKNRDMGDYEIITPENSPDYPLHFCKMCNRKTTLIEDKAIPCLIGLYIDIFPLDGTCDDAKDALVIMQHYHKLKNRLQAISTHNTFADYLKLLLTPKDWGRFVYKTFGFFFRKQYRRSLLKRLDAICRSHSYEDAKTVILYSGGYGRRDIYPKEWFRGTTKAVFENVEVDLPVDFEEYLRQLYGDYTQLPPVEQRISHPKAYFNMDRRLTMDETMDEIKAEESK